MADEFTEVSTEGFGSRLGGSIMGMLFGFILLPISVILLYWNEGRAVEAIQALDRGAKQLVEIAADPLDSSAEGKLVHVSGLLKVGTPAKDPVFGVSAPNLARLERTAQMYQWKEESHSESHESVGGSKTTETTYTYSQAWSSQPIDSSRFKHPTEHQNPAMPIHGETFNSGDTKLGAYAVGSDVLDKLSDFQTLSPDTSNAPEGYRRDGDGFFHGKGGASNPAIGDVKVTFAGVTAQPVSIVAGLSGGNLTAFHGNKGYEIVMARTGLATAAELFQEKKKEESNLTWILRGAGCVVMLIGFLLFARPVSMALAFLPFLEGIAETGAFVIALMLTLPLTLLTIAIAWIVHRPVIGVGLLVAAAACFWLLSQMRKRPTAR